jgi:predicted glycoside hydrolase/deacetylase ChbG (UPF0249 family)
LKRLVINADDFGFTSDVNAGIVHAHREGILTATTLMANGAAFDDAVRLAAENPELDVGCHLVLVQGYSSVTGEPLPRKLQGVVIGVASGKLNPYVEFRSQIQRILDAGIRPSHLDTHKHTHILPAVFRAAVKLAAEFQIPFLRVPVPAAGSNAIRRAYASAARIRGICMTDHFAGFRLTGSLTEQTFAAALSSLREGTTEFMCHPGFLGPELQAAETRLKESRVRELEALISPRIRQILQANKIQLCNFRDISGSAHAS